MATVRFSTRAWDEFGLWREAKRGVLVMGCTGLRAQSLCGITVCGTESGKEHFSQLHRSLPHASSILLVSGCQQRRAGVSKEAQILRKSMENRNRDLCGGNPNRQIRTEFS